MIPKVPKNTEQHSTNLQDRDGLQQAVPEWSHAVVSRARNSVIEEDLLWGLCFTRSTLARYQNALVLPLCPHGSVSVVWQGVAKEGQWKLLESHKEYEKTQTFC